MTKPEYKYPEPVPHATQLAVAPFLAAVEGYLSLSAGGKVEGLRITMHRLVNREGQEYLQQISPYFPLNEEDPQSTVGRLFAVTEGVIGEAYASKKMLRTRAFPDEASLHEALRRDMNDVGDKRDLSAVRTSYIAVPFLGSSGGVVLILFADCKAPNFFADDDRVAAVVSMCNGFCRLFDSLQDRPFPNLRNFQFPKGTPAMSVRTVYPRLQEQLSDYVPPTFQKVDSFNYEASVS